MNVMVRILFMVIGVLVMMNFRLMIRQMLRMRLLRLALVALILQIPAVRSMVSKQAQTQ